MQPIISPMFIYLIGVINNLKLLFLIFGIASLIISGAGACTEFEEKGFIPKWCKILFVTGLLNCTLVAIIPNRDTLIAMYTTKYITVENVKLGKEVVIDTVKEIVDAINRKERD